MEENCTKLKSETVRKGITKTGVTGWITRNERPKRVKWTEDKINKSQYKTERKRHKINKVEKHQWITRIKRLKEGKKTYKKKKRKKKL